MEDTQLFYLIGQRIKHFREEKKLSQLEFSTLCDIEKTNLSRIEVGKTNLTLKSLYKISQSLKVRLSDIVDVEELDFKEY